jgi:hypothetical protein
LVMEKFCPMKRMMVSFMLSSASFNRLARWLVVGVLALCAAPQLLYAAEGVSVKSAEIHAGSEGYELDAQFVLTPNSTLADALEKGVALHFVVELEIERPRGWWWFNENIVETSRRMRIYYNLLLRRYVVDAGYVTKTAATLDEALMILGRIEKWQVLERGALKVGQKYTARMRLRMDVSQLAKPLQINAIASGRWDMDSSWHEWTFDAPAISKLATFLP